MADPPFVRVQVNGLNELLRDLRKMQNTEIPKAIQQANKQAAEVVIPSARAEAPQLTGKLAQSIKAKATKKAGSVKAGSSKVPYAGPIHFGWGRRNINPRPFLYRAIDRNTERIRAQYEEAIRRVVNRFNG